MIRHVVRMRDERLTKAMVFGWYEGLDGKPMMKGRKRKTVLYWKRMLREWGGGGGGGGGGWIGTM